LSVTDSERRTASGLLELVAIEMAQPRLLAASAPALAGVVHRLRTSGSIAFALCQLAGGRLDGMATLADCRSVDAAAAQLIVRESGGVVAFSTTGDALAVSLELSARFPLRAARSATALAELGVLPSSEV